MKKYKVTVNGTAYEIEIEEVEGGAAPVAEKKPEPTATEKPVANGEKVTAPMPGNLLDVRVSEGATVKKGDVLFILEAMKMENEIMASVDGKVVSVNAKKGDSVETGAVLCVIG